MNALTDRLKNLQISLRWRITLPFLLLALLLGLGATYFVLRLIQETSEERLLRQLANSGQQAVDAVVGVEQDLLAMERLVANTEGVLPSTLANDAEDLRQRILPLVVNAEADVVVVIDEEGTSLLAIRRLPVAEAGNYETVRGEAIYADWNFVKAVLSRRDQNQSKQIGLGQVQVGDEELPTMFVVGPIETDSGRLVGAVLAGEYLNDVVARIATTSGSNVILYATQTGDPLGSSFSEEQGAIDRLPEVWLQQTFSTEIGTPVRRIEVAGVPYREALSPFTAREGNTVLGILGVSLLDTTQGNQALADEQRSQNTARLVGIIGAVGLLLIGVIGLLISHSITQPLVEIAEASQQVATGNLDIEVPERGGGEVTVVARSFNQMVRGLRQSTEGFDWQSHQLPVGSRRAWEEAETLPVPEVEEVAASILAISISARPGADPMVDPDRMAHQAWQRAELLLRIIHKHRGQLLSFDGNQGMASFGMPPERQPLSVSALVGSHAAVAVVEELRSVDLASRSSAGSGFVATTILHCGLVAKTDMGQRYGLSPTVYGAIVNDAKELLGVAAQRQEGGVLITEAVHQQLSSTRSQFIFGRKGVVSLRAPGGKIKVYEVQERRIRLIETEPPV